jgi:hypothetical protein
LSARSRNNTYFIVTMIVRVNRPGFAGDRLV